MAIVDGNMARIRTNIPAQNAYNALDNSSREVSLRQLRLSTGKRINNASDDVAGYITSRSLKARNGALESALKAVGDTQNIMAIIQDSLDNINGLVTTMKDATAQASSGVMGTDEKVALGKAAYRLAQQVQTVVDSTVFGGRQLIDGTFDAEFMIGYNSENTPLAVRIDMTPDNIDFNVETNYFNVNSLSEKDFAGVCGLDLRMLNDINGEDLGIFSEENIVLTLQSLAFALENTNKVASYIGGISNRMTSQEELLQSQIVNYNAAISRLEDADIAKEQLHKIKAQFLQQASITSLAQANQNPNSFLQLIQS